MAASPPSYLTASFIESSLRKRQPEMTVTTVEITPAVRVGENYACDVFRVHVTTNHGPVSLIVKCLGEVKFSSNNKFTTRECKFYKEFLPLFDIKLHPSVPLCYDGIKSGPIDALILQDMKPEGFKLHDRLQGLDQAHCKVVLKELARLHALSVKFRMENPNRFNVEIFNEFQHLYREENRRGSSNLFKVVFSNFSRGIKECYPYRYQCLAQVIDEFIDPVFDLMVDLLTLTPEEIAEQVLVLTHADLWTSNILFRYDQENTPIQSCMIDFQLARCTNPVSDLTYFFYISTTQSMRKQHMNDLLQFYLDQVYSDLQEMGVSKPLPQNMFYESLDELWDDMKRNAFPNFIRLWALPLSLADPKNLPNFESMFNEIKESDTSLSVKHNVILRERFREVLDDLDDMGCFTQARKLLASRKPN